MSEQERTNPTSDVKSGGEDKVFESRTFPGGFKFDRSVAGVFENMLLRSVPGYENIIAMSGFLAGKYAQAGRNYYDLGCSLGATALAMQRNIAAENCCIYAVDNSLPMIERCREIVAMEPEHPAQLEVLCADINEIKFANNAMTAINFTLQFIAPELRAGLLKKIYDSMVPGGVLVLSEKIKLEDSVENDFFVEIYHQWKIGNGYSRREVERKREALENVLIPDTVSGHRQRLEMVGFSHFSVWFQCFNFVSMVAFK
ncbi:MAG: carboxy-S-adenosyl-L-methionine synthase CmoA [Lentisphaeria bacterium]|nr:carboxy-S-adenosyl-L-methionine synthase CmoA [Lentisphaeria bacterium]